MIGQLENGVYDMQKEGASSESESSVKSKSGRSSDFDFGEHIDAEFPETGEGPEVFHFHSISLFAKTTYSCI